MKELEKFETEQDYFEEYNRIKDAAIFDIKNSAGYQLFNEEDMNKLAPVSHKNLPRRDIFHATNDGRIFISIDMKAANFSSLSHYDPEIFGGAKTWEEFIGRYTDNKHIIGSKYIRQVILGNCNCKRHITYEKSLMDKVLTEIEEREIISTDYLCFFSNDEIIYDVTDMDDISIGYALFRLTILKEEIDIPVEIEEFTLGKIHGTGVYWKYFNEDYYEFKCLDSNIAAMIVRKFCGKEITENDKVFYHDGLLAKYIEIPEVLT